jgi:hypothetical protein
MRLVKISTTVTAFLALLGVPASGGQHGNSGAHGPATTATHGPSTIHAPSTAAAKPAKVQSPKHAPSTQKTKLTKVATGTTTSGAKSVRSKKGDATSTTSASSSSSTTTSGATTTADFTTGIVGSKLSKNVALRTKLESRLKTLGYTGTAYQAAYGFKNLGQFVAATNVSRNVGISFEQLKLQMTGFSVKADGTVLRANTGADGKVTMVDPSRVTTAAPTRSLGQSIQTVKSSLDAPAVAQTATTQADAEIKATTVSK